MTGSISTILVPVDGSEDAILAAQIAADLAKRTGAALHLVHAWQIVVFAGDGFLYPSALPDDYFTMYEESGRAILELEATRVAEQGYAGAKTHLIEGRPSDAIVELAREIGADLIVVGSRGLGPIRRVVLGSVSDGIAHHAACPVLVVRGGAEAWPPQRVITGDDGSPAADAATALAARIANLYGAKGMLVRGYPPALTPDLASSSTAQRHDEQLEAAEQALAERAASLTEAFGAPPEPRLAIGDPAALIVAVAEIANTPTLIAVGSRGLGAFQRFRLGSTSTKVLHAAHCPVLIAPGIREGDEGGTR